MEYKEYIAITTCKHLKAKYIPANIFEKINNEIMMFYEYEFQDNSILDPLLINYNSYKPVKFTKFIEDVFNKLKTTADNITVNNLENNLSFYITIYEKFLDFIKEYIINDQSNCLDRYKNAIRCDAECYGGLSYTTARSGLNELKKCNYNDDENIYINENETYREEEHESNENILLFSKSNIAKDVNNSFNTLDITTSGQKLNENLRNINKLFRDTLSNICDICKNIEKKDSKIVPFHKYDFIIEFKNKNDDKNFNNSLQKLISSQQSNSLQELYYKTVEELQLFMIRDLIRLATEYKNLEQHTGVRQYDVLKLKEKIININIFYYK